MKLSNNFTRRRVAALTILIMMLWCGTAAQAQQTTAFTYQGRFTDSSVQQPTNGSYTMTFRLYDAATGGNQIPDNLSSVTSMVSVVNNIFTTRLDFGGAAFNTTAARYLEIQVGQTVLTPRQEITSTPFAQRAINAANADRLNGLPSDRYVQTNDSRLTDSRSPAAGSGNYIQNGTTQQTSSNFNISGGGTVNSLAIRSGGAGLTLNDNFLHLRTATDNNHGIVYNSAIDGPEFRASNSFRWTNGTSGATERMKLDAFGNLAVNGNLTTNRVTGTNFLARGGTPGASGTSNNGYAFSGNSGDNDSGLFSEADGRVSLFTDNIERVRVEGTTTNVTGNLSVSGTISGTLADNSVGSAQVVDRSLRLSDVAAVNTYLAGFGGPFAAHTCSEISALPGTITGLAVNDVVYLIPPDTSPKGFSFQPVYLTQTAPLSFPVCNTLNTSNTLPAQSYQVIALRP